MHLIAAIDSLRPRGGLRAHSAIWLYLVVFCLSLVLLYRPHNLAAAVPIGLGQILETQTAHAQQAGAIAPVAPTSSPAALPTDTHDSPWPNTYAHGNCTWYVAHLRPVPPHWGNAASWASSAHRAGWKVSPQPQIGAVAWTPAGWVGHVAVVLDVQPGRVLVTEMNHIGFNRIDQRWVPTGQFKYIYEN